ncbi:cornifelin homolog B-like isoform X1 [Osmerus eperlanus]|uniref:cornifelin homolog B-like isoform X1 n=2 Tax=Osmerus eperlanus TaxID=29151 RepID=UPI002E0D4C71
MTPADTGILLRRFLVGLAPVVVIYLCVFIVSLLHVISILVYFKIVTTLPRPEVSISLSHHSHLYKHRLDVIMPSKMIIRQPEPVMESKESDQWGSKICDCCEDVPDCCFACWCCPCYACKHSKAYGQCLCLPLLDMFGFIPPVSMAMRVSMRHRYGIKDTMCNDCLYATFCNCCSWCQISKEMRRRNIPIILVSAKNT